MSEIECLLSSCFCCLNFNECCVDYISHKSYKSIKDKKDEKDDQMEVFFFYDETYERIDKNIHQIIFYEEYLQGYYSSVSNISNIYNISNISNKNILVIYNKNVSIISNIVNIINNIHTNKGLSINNKKWFPKQIWIFN
jgi:hypothetical protein